MNGSGPADTGPPEHVDHAARAGLLVAQEVDQTQANFIQQQAAQIWELEAQLASLRGQQQVLAHSRREPAEARVVQPSLHAQPREATLHVRVGDQVQERAGNNGVRVGPPGTTPFPLAHGGGPFPNVLAHNFVPEPQADATRLDELATALREVQRQQAAHMERLQVMRPVGGPSGVPR
eukprot:334377-Chlamydomonas_euryale.AAC.1